MTEHRFNPTTNTMMPTDAALHYFVTQQVRPGDTLTLEGEFVVPHKGEYTVQGLQGSTVDMTHATFIREAVDSSDRYGTHVFAFMDCEDTQAVGGRIDDCNDSWQSALRPRELPNGHWTNYEGFSAVKIIRSSVNWAEASVSDSVSDFCAIVGECGDVSLSDWSCETAGRHGVSWRNVQHLSLKNMNMRKIRRIRYDHEPTPSPEGFDSLEIIGDRGETGNIIHGYLQLVAAGGKIRPASRMGPVLIEDAELSEGHFKIYVGVGSVQRPHSFRMIDCVALDTEPANLAPGERLIQIGAVTGLSNGYDTVVVKTLRETVRPNAVTLGRALKLSPNTHEALLTDIDWDAWGVFPAT